MQIVKVQYYKEAINDFTGYGYSYYTEDTLKVGDIVKALVKDEGWSRAKVIAIDIPESEIVRFKEAMKTIPAESIFKQQAEETTEEDGLEIERRDAKAEYICEEETLIHRENEFIDNMSQNDPVTTAIIMICPESSLGYSNLFSALTNLKRYAEERVIKTASDILPATDDLALISRLKKQLTTLRDEYVKPIRGHLDDVMRPFSELSGLLVVAELTNKDKISAFDTAQKARAAEIAEVNRQTEEIARKQAALSGGEFTVDTTPIEAPAPIKHVSTQSGTASIVKAPSTWELEDWALVPDQYKMLDTTKIGKVIRAGGSIPGIKIIQQTGIRVTTR
jgi:hypothetical protein